MRLCWRRDLAAGLLSTARMQLRHLRLAFAPLALLATAAPALADDAAPPAAAPARFTTLAPDGLRSELSGELVLGMPDEGDENLFNAFLEGQYMTPDGFGGYGRVSYSSIDEASGLSNLEVGALYRIDSGETSLALRGGLVVPTGPQVDDGFDAFAAILGTVARRPSDLVLGATEATVLRLSAAPTYRSGNLVLRGDAGLDLVIDSPADDPDPLYHVDLAAGFVQDRFAGTVEFTTIGSTDTDDEGRYHIIALGGQYDLGSVQVKATLARPFFSGDGDDDFDITTVALGVSAPL